MRKPGLYIKVHLTETMKKYATLVMLYGIYLLFENRNCVYPDGLEGSWSEYIMHAHTVLLFILLISQQIHDYRNLFISDLLEIEIKCTAD